MNHSDEPDNVMDLIVKFVSETITEAEADHLLRAVQNNNNSFNLLLANMEADFILHKMFSLENSIAAQFADEVHEELLMSPDPEKWTDLLAWEKSTKPIIDDPLPRIKKQRPNKIQRSVFSTLKKEADPSKKPEKHSFSYLFVSAVFLFFALIGWVEWSSRHQQNSANDFIPVARLSETVDAVWGSEDSAMKRGQSIVSRRITLTSGLAKFEFKNGADLVLEGPADFVINGPMSTFCGEGKISARIPKEAVGFEIATPFATVIDRGTEFLLDVNKKKATVSVIKGLVDFAPPNQTVPVLTEKMASIIDLSMKRTPIDFNSDDYYTPNKFEKALQNYSNKITREENTINSVLNGRADLLARYNFNRNDLGTIPNTSTGLQSLGGSASVLSSDLCEGSRYGTRAAQLNRKQSRINLPVSGIFRDLTLFLTVRADRLDRTGSILLSTNDEENATSFVLQIFYNGALKFRINQPDGADHQELVSSPFFFKTNYGTWYDLAVVIDSGSKKIALYSDGKKMAESPCPDLKPLDLRSLTIGNNTLKITKGESRFWGAVEDFMIFNRALPQEDLQQIRKQ